MAIISQNTSEKKVEQQENSKFNYEIYKAALNYRQTPVLTPWTFCTNDTPYIDARTGEEKYALISTRASEASNAGKAVWVQVNPVNEETAITKSGNPKKAKKSDIIAIHNVSMEFEYPQNPEISHKVARDFVNRLIAAGFVDPSLPIEDSGAGDHIIIPIQAIDMEDETQDLWNDAVRRVVQKHFKKLFSDACASQGVKLDDKHMCLGSYSIEHLMSVPGTYRPYNPDKNDCDALKNGYLRGWLSPYVNGNYPERIESEAVRRLIIEEFVAGPEVANTTAKKNEDATLEMFGNRAEFTEWLEDYYQKKQTGDRSIDFSTVVWGCYAKYGEDVTRLLTKEIDELCGNKYDERAEIELERCLVKAMNQVQRSANIAKASALPSNPEVTDEQLCFFTADDAGNADAMYALFGEYFRWCGTRGWLFYCGTHWELDPEGAVTKRKAVETLRTRRHAAVENENEAVLKCTKGDTRRISGCLDLFKTLVDTDIIEFDNNPDAINCANGVVDLRTGILEPHNSSQMFTYCLKVPYEPCDYAEWADYLNGVVGGGKETLDYLQMSAGYSLTGHTSEECLFYLHGPTRSGKGTYAETMMGIMPEPIFTMVDFNSFTSKREGDVSNFDLAPLKPSRLVFASESNQYQTLNPAKIKQMTGGDKITCSFKHKNFFTYRPQFKVWMLSNHQVNGDPEDDALWGRVRVIPFPNSYLGKEDKSKKSRMKSLEVQKGVLYWAILGAIKWYSTGSTGLKTPDAVKSITNKHRSDLDYVEKWFEACCESDPEAWTSSEEVQTSYLTWCKANGVTHPKSPKGLAESLNRLKCVTGDEARKRVNGKQLRGVKGLKLVSNSPEEYDFSKEL